MILKSGSIKLCYFPKKILNYVIHLKFSYDCVSFKKKNIELYQVMLGAMFQDMSCLWFIVIKFGLARGVNLKPRSIQVEDKIEEGIDLIKNLG